MLYDKTFESDYFFFLHQNQNIFFSNIGNQNIFLEKDAAIKLHKYPNENWFLKWTKLLNRVKYQVTKHTRICSKGTTI
jgi:hypothetical protein